MIRLTLPQIWAGLIGVWLLTALCSVAPSALLWGRLYLAEAEQREMAQEFARQAPLWVALEESLTVSRAVVREYRREIGLLMQYGQGWRREAEARGRRIRQLEVVE